MWQPNFDDWMNALEIPEIKSAWEKADEAALRGELSEKMWHLRTDYPPAHGEEVDYNKEIPSLGISTPVMEAHGLKLFSASEIARFINDSKGHEIEPSHKFYVKEELKDVYRDYSYQHMIRKAISLDKGWKDEEGRRRKPMAVSGGEQQLKQQARADIASVFILPPSTDELAHRLRRRAQDPDDVVAARMARAPDEISHWPEYDYIIVNRDIDESVSRVQAILESERLKRHRQVGLPNFVKRLRDGL